MRKFAIAAVAAATVALGLAAPAHADHFVRTEVSWTGAPCIEVYVSNVTATTFVPRVACGGSYVYTEGNVWYGDQIGVDPVMGSASYIECTMWIDGVMSWSDAAVAGDGSD